MGQFLYVPPYLNWALFGEVAVGGGSPSLLDEDHDADWLVDGRPGFPLRLTEPDGAVTITNPSGLVDIIAICHHLLDGGIGVAVSGDVTASLTMPTIPRNGVPLNAWVQITPVSGVDSVTLTFGGGSPSNSTDVLVGEVVIGSALVLDPPIRVDGSRFAEIQYVGARTEPLSGIAPYSERARSRTFGGSQYTSQEGLDALKEWVDSQDGYAYQIPSLIIPDSDDPTDARLVVVSQLTYSQTGPDGSETQYLVELEFTELPRTRW